MDTNQAELSYYRAAVEEATPVGLTVLLYDLLITDLRRAIAAIKEGKIEPRAIALKHAFSVLQLLEGSLDLNLGGATAESLAQFYSYLRSQVMTAHFRADAQTLEEQIRLILEVREAWQQIDSRRALEVVVSPLLPNQTDAPDRSEPTIGNRWSA